MSDWTAPRGLGPFDPYSMDAAARPSVGRRRGLVTRAALGLMAGIGFVGAAAFGAAPPSAPNPKAAPTSASSGEIVDPSLAPLFAFEMGDGARARYEARVDRATGARRDGLSVGAFGDATPALRLEMWKDRNARAAGLFVEIAEQSAGFGAAVVRLGASQIIASSQGPVEWAPVSLSDGRAERGCVGFRLVARAEGGLRGVACAAAGATIEGSDVSCLVDRLTLTRAGREGGFADIMKGEKGRRPSCRAAIV